MIRSWIENQRSTFLKPSSWRNVALALSLSSATVAAQSEPRSLKPGSASAAPTAQAPTAQAPRTATGADTAPNEGGQGEREQGVSLQLPIERYQLPNGLRVVLNPDTSSPTAAVCITYDVGSRNEQRGRSGFAHLFEHMMFQGSRNLPKGGHFTMIASRGGSLNGTTSSDRTNYFQVVPSNALATVLWLEADRMKNLAIPQENF